MCILYRRLGRFENGGGGGGVPKTVFRRFRRNGLTFPSVWRDINRKAGVGFAERSPSMRNDNDDDHLRVDLARDGFYDTDASASKTLLTTRCCANRDGGIGRTV